MKKIPFAQNTKVDLTADEIEQYKKEYKEVYLIEVEDKKCFLHPPTRQILDAARAGSKKADSKFNEILLEGCWLAGNKEMITEDEYFLSASAQLGEIITYKDSSIKKL